MAEASTQPAAVPQRNSALSVSEVSVSVKDYAYSDDNPMHYGVYEEGSEEYEDEDDEDGDDYGDSDNFEFTLKKDEFGKVSSSARKAIPPPGEMGEEDAESETVTHAVALYPFEPENENELRLTTDQIIIINYEYGDGWLVAHDPFSGKTGLVPSGYVRIMGPEVEFAEEVLDEDEVSSATPYLPEMLQSRRNSQKSHTSDKPPTDDPIDTATDKLKKLEVS